jgi:flagellar motor switch protein FliN/FliY
MADDSEQIGQDEIEQLLKQAQAAGGAAAESPPPAEDAANPVGQDEIEALMQQAGVASSPPADSQSSAADGSLDQGEIEKLLGQTGSPAAPKPVTPKNVSPASHTEEEESMPAGDVELLLNQAQEALDSVQQPHDSPQLGEMMPYQLRQFSGAAPSEESATLELIRDVELDVKIELGRANMQLDDVLRLHKGSVVTLDKLAGDPVDVYVNGRLIARGEVLVLNDSFCVRIAELVVGEIAVA